MDSPLFSTYGNRINRALSSANDFRNERHRINKRLTKLRRALNIRNKNTKSYKKKDITVQDYQQNPKFADVLLLTVERDLSYINEVKYVISVQSSKSKENFIKSKYKKCVSNVQKLLAIIDDDESSTEVSNEVKLQTYIYAALLQGSFSFSRKKWDDTLFASSIARLGLQSIIEDTKTNTDLKQTCTDILINQVDPILKLSLYNTDSTQSVSPNLNQISRKKATLNTIPYLTPALKLLDPSFLNQEDDYDMDLVREITWSKFTCEVRNEDTARLIADANQKLAIAHKDSLSYDPALLAWQDLLEHHTAEMEKAQDELSDEEIQDNQILATFISYQLNLSKVERDFTLVEEIDSSNKKNSIKKSLKILDNVLSTLSDTKELPGVYNDEQIWKNIEAYEAYFQVNKLIKIAQAHLAEEKYINALALLNKAYSSLQNVSESSLMSDTDSFPKLPTMDTLHDLTQQLEQKLANVQAVAEYYNYRAQHNIGNGDVYYAQDTSKIPNDYQKLVNVRDFQMVHQKPVLFDIAFNYISYNSPEGAIASGSTQAASSQPQEQKKGFFGLFGGSN